MRDEALIGRDFCVQISVGQRRWGRRIMALWVRFEHDDRLKVGTVQDDTITVHNGDMFRGATRTGERVKPVSYTHLTLPTTPYV